VRGLLGTASLSVTGPSGPFCEIWLRSSIPAAAQEKKTKKPHGVPCQKRTYKPTGMIGDGYFDAPGSEHLPQLEMEKDRGVWEGTPYTTSDGDTVFLEHAEFSSADIASKNFDAVVASAPRVLERGPTIGREGTASGERVLLDFSKDGHGSFTVMWQNKEYLYFLKSSSLQGVEDFEEKVVFNCK
jgi:hypothetical protein